MKFLAIDTSGAYLSVLAYRDGAAEKGYLPDCALKHSVLLMGEIDGVLARAHMSVRDCDFFAAVVGPGSFTGIRIGISTAKGLCLACGKPALGLTSFDVLAYNAGKKPLVALTDAGHGCYYAACYSAEKALCVPPAFLPRAEVDALIGRGFFPVATEKLFEGCSVADPSEGLLRAVLAKAGELKPASELKATYLRKSSAEENRK